MACVVVYDANVLYGNTLRDILIRVARSRLVQAKWSDRILDEAMDNLAARRPDIERVKLDRLRTLMNAAVPDSLIAGYEPLIEGLKLPDPDDRHDQYGRKTISVGCPSRGVSIAVRTVPATVSGLRNSSARYSRPSPATISRCMSVSIRPG